MPTRAPGPSGVIDPSDRTDAGDLTYLTDFVDPIDPRLPAGRCRPRLVLQRPARGPFILNRLLCAGTGGVLTAGGDGANGGSRTLAVSGPDPDPTAP